jgi:adenosylhomocysteine nucleosidase
MIGIIGAMEDEVAFLRGAIVDGETVRAGGYEFYLGALEGRSVVLLRCGIGKVNAAVGCALLIDRFKPGMVLNTGTAGGLDPSLSFGDTVIAEGLLYHDADVTGFNYVPGQLPGMPPVFNAAPGLVCAAEEAVDELRAEGALPEGIRHVRGIIGSGDVFLHESGKIAAVRSTFPCLTAADMEAAAIAQTCYLLSVPVLVIRALSDIAGAESPVTFDQFLAAASRNSAEIVRRIVRKS